MNIFGDIAKLGSEEYFIRLLQEGVPCLKNIIDGLCNVEDMRVKCKKLLQEKETEDKSQQTQAIQSILGQLHIREDKKENIDHQLLKQTSLRFAQLANQKKLQKNEETGKYHINFQFFCKELIDQSNIICCDSSGNIMDIGQPEVVLRLLKTEHGDFEITDKDRIISFLEELNNNNRAVNPISLYQELQVEQKKFLRGEYQQYITQFTRINISQLVLKKALESINVSNQLREFQKQSEKLKLKQKELNKLKQNLESTKNQRSLWSIFTEKNQAQKKTQSTVQSEIKVFYDQHKSIQTLSEQEKRIEDKQIRRLGAKFYIEKLEKQFDAKQQSLKQEIDKQIKDNQALVVKKLEKLVEDLSFLGTNKSIIKHFKKHVENLEKQNDLISFQTLIKSISAYVKETLHKLPEQKGFQKEINQIENFFQGNKEIEGTITELLENNRYLYWRYITAREK